MNNRILIAAWSQFNCAAPRLFLAACMLVAFFVGRARAEDYGLCLGGGGVVEAPAPKLPADGKQLCVEFRFKALMPLSAATRIVSQWPDDPKAADEGAFHADLLPANHVSFTLRVGKGRTDTITAKDAWTLQAWHHVLATWNGTGIALYLDGKLIATHKIEGAAVPLSVLPLTVGQGSGPGKISQGKPAFHGFVSDVALWSVVPGTEVIAGRGTKGITPGDAGLAAFLPLRESAPAEVVKETVSGQDAKLSPGLARTGWCATPMWDQPAPARPYLNIFAYDLSTAAKTAGSDAPPAMVSPARMILLQDPKTQQFGVLWQDKSSNGIYITWIDPDLKSHETFRLKGLEDGILAAGCADASGHVCYFEIEKTPADRDAAKPLNAILHIAGSDGKAVAEAPIPLTNGDNGLNVWNYGGRWVGSMAYAKGTLGLILPRTMYKSPDGLNHQGAIAVVFAANDPAKYRNFGQIAGHEFGNILYVNSAGDFLGLDLCDMYSRGVGIHKFNAAASVSRTVFTFKVHHATEPRNDSPKYAEISVNGKTYYQWSNDNDTYTELGGVAEGRGSYSVFFSTDRSVDGRVLDNSRAFNNCDDSRDLAMVRVVKSFEQTKGHGSEVGDDIFAGGPPPGSTAETGGFYSFAGQWSRQREAGVIWLTHHKPGESAHAPHPVRQADGSIRILWEKTSPDGADLCATQVTEEGKIVGESVLPGSSLHLNREDKFVSANGRDYLLATNKETGADELCFVYEELPAAPQATKPATPNRFAPVPIPNANARAAEK